MNWPLYRRISATAVTGILSVGLFLSLWRYYEVAPRTPDGKIRADIILVAPDVSGPITRVFVTDNQRVKMGAPLFEIDRSRFEIDAARAEAALHAKQIALSQAQRTSHRNATLGELVAHEETEQGQEKVAVLAAEVQQAQADLAAARLDLARSTVRASVDGTIANFSLRPGSYATAGKAVFALIDRGSIHVDGYFEETKLHRIHVGDRARIRLMGESAAIDGHVASIAGGIEDRDRTTGNTLLADVNPTFSWVRLAQRIPVRIALDHPSTANNLVLGRTAAVEILSVSEKRK